ncbi:uncharacterized protein V6R79_018164 [Siganus canaliculatus]
MQRLVVICWALLALAGAEECPDGGKCKDGQTCCHDPIDGYECCPFDMAECCEDHAHCCPAGTICRVATSSCVNATASIPWVERTTAEQPRLSKSFRMIKSYMGEEDDNVCPDQSRCPPEFSCLKALTRFSCCPLAQGVSCPDGKHCCPETHQCSADSRSCIEKEVMTTVMCEDGVSECPDGTTCCKNPEGKYGCCPMPKAVCCEDKIHCCPEGTSCDLQQAKCISPVTNKEMPMWAKFPARIRADWENQKKAKQVTAQTLDDNSEKTPEATTANTVPLTKEKTTVSSVAKAAAGNVSCDGTASCPDGTTCCKNESGDWACCPLPEAVCCEDHIHCCPHGTTCNLASETCDSSTCSVAWVKKVPAIPKLDVQATNVTCDSTSSCPDGTTCCKNEQGKWACCPLPRAVCCDDHEHCCPEGTTCNLPASTCDSSAGSTPMLQKMPAFVTEAPSTVSTAAPNTEQPGEEDKEPEEEDKEPGEEDKEPGEEDKEPEEEDKEPKEAEAVTGMMVTDEEKTEETEDEDMGDAEGLVQCDQHTSCPHSATCCFMKSSQRFGCCPLPKAVCCADGDHCCPTDYKCNESKNTCTRGEVVIPWYTKLPAVASNQADTTSVQCDDVTQCPEHTTCCQLATGEWGCCPLQDAVCCPDKKHCCPHGYTCNGAANSCQKVIMLQLDTLPLTPVYPLENQPIVRNVKCDDETNCKDKETCCKMSDTEWGCCPLPNAVCCSDMLHCCASGFTCVEGGECVQNTKLRWFNWHVFLTNKKRVLV